MGKKQKINEKGVPCGARQKMPIWYGMAWSARGISVSINAVLLMQIAYYCTDILGLNAAIIGTLFLVSKIIDAFTDLGFGFILDKTHTRFGKARPYEIFIVFLWLFTVFMFNAPSMGQTGQYIWIFVLYVLINAVCSTALGGCDAVYLARTFTTKKNQVSVMSINGFIVMFTTIVFNIWFPSWIATQGTTREGWASLIIPLGITMAAIGMIRFVVCKEIVMDAPLQDGKQKEKSISLKNSLGILGKNKYLFIVVGLMFLTSLVNNMSTAATYYFKYIVGDISLQGTVAITSMIVVPALVVFPILSNKFGTTKILQGAILVGAVGIIIRTIGGTNLATLIVGGCLFGVGTLPISMMINTYLIDCMDYGEWKTGTRVEGLVASIGNFSGKVANGAAFGVVGLVMGIAQYNGKAEVQSATANAAIIFLYNVLPMIVFIIMFLLSLNYKVDKIRPQMEADLKEKHGN